MRAAFACAFTELAKLKPLRRICLLVRFGVGKDQIALKKLGPVLFPLKSSSSGFLSFSRFREAFPVFSCSIECECLDFLSFSAVFLAVFWAAVSFVVFFAGCSPAGCLVVAFSRCWLSLDCPAVLFSCLLWRSIRGCFERFILPIFDL